MFIGLTGGISSGKSTVSKILEEEYDAIVIDADKISRELCEPGEIIYLSLTLSFAAEGSSDKYLNKDLTINRKALAERMFNNPNDKRAIEGMMHNHIVTEMVARGVRHYIDNPKTLIVYDVPLLFEVGFEEHVKKTIVVDIEPQEQLKRLMKRNELSMRDAHARINAQMSRNERLSKADYVINNNKDEKHLKKEIQRVMQEINSL